MAGHFEGRATLTDPDETTDDLIQAASNILVMSEIKDGLLLQRKYEREGASKAARIAQRRRQRMAERQHLRDETNSGSESDRLSSVSTCPSPTTTPPNTALRFLL